jgi:hypothetical protein
MYEVRTSTLVKPDDLSPTPHEDLSWVTLITRKGYKEKSGKYTYRRVVRAVLVAIEPDKYVITSKNCIDSISFRGIHLTNENIKTQGFTLSFCCQYGWVACSFSNLKNGEDCFCLYAKRWCKGYVV